MKHSFLKIIFLVLLLPLPTGSAQDFYSSEYGLFSTRPDATGSLYNIKRFGPVGMGIDLIQPAFTMRISNIEKGSPAEKTGELKAGMIIESINDEKLEKIDPRIQLGKILERAEATDGKVRFKIRGKSEPVTVRIPVLGAYSDTWPLDCPKSDRIVRQVADYLARPDATEGLGGIGMLFLLSTGEEKDLKIVQQWARSAPAHTYPWYLGYGGIPLAECYLRTGDPEILANIQRWVDNAVKAQHNDAWSGRGAALTTYGNGHLNASGTCVLTFLLLARECGAEVPDYALLRALRHFYRYAGRGGNPYGDDRPELGFVDNGKNGKLAFAMAAAAAVTPDGEDSVYARARDICANQSFYTTSFMLHGHTGGGIGEIWRSAAMGLLLEKRPAQYREFMDHRKWHYDLSRRFDGSFGILGGAGYDKELWGVALPLAYTVPRKTLRITGAPPTKYSHPYKLPEQPWGNAADNRFLSLEAVADRNGVRQDLSGETLRNDSSMPFLRRFHGSKQPTDDEIRQYMFHPDPNIRFVAANKVLGINSGYIGWRSPGGKVRRHLILELLRHEDPRVRRAMFSALVKRPDVLDDEIFTLAVGAVRDPDESWWVKDAALQLIGHGTPDQIAPLVDLLLPYLEHEEDWLKNASLQALTPVVADARCYQRVLPAIGQLLKKNQRVSVTRGLAGPIREKINRASPEVKKLAVTTLRETYTGFKGQLTSPAGKDLSSTYDFHLDAIAASLADVDGGLDVLYDIARKKYPNEILPYKEYFLKADPRKFGPKLKQAIIPIILDELIPEYVGRNRETLGRLARGEIQSGFPGGTRDAIDNLVSLYRRAGRTEYEWQMFVDLRKAEWDYHSFDPIPTEQVPFDQLITRYRPVTLPRGMTDWYLPKSTSARAGWKQGLSPFGNYNGKIPDRPITKCSPGCLGPGCFGATPVNTLWDKEVLMIFGTFELPPLEPGYRYRIRVNDGNHVGSGGGHKIYINGKPLIEVKQGNGRGSGGLPKGAYITKEFLEDLRQGEISIGVLTFIRYNDKYKTKPKSRIPQGKISLHLEKQKLPPMGDELVRKSATVVAMLSSRWQADQDPSDRERKLAAVKFRYDGKFIPNPELVGGWVPVGSVKTLDEFDPEKRLNPRSVKLGSMDFRTDGSTNSVTHIWSGNMLMDLTKYEALRMVVRQFNGVDYLFVEAGGFHENKGPDWRPAWYVLKRPVR